jgi:hypothetical protein
VPASFRTIEHEQAVRLVKPLDEVSRALEDVLFFDLPAPTATSSFPVASTTRIHRHKRHGAFHLFFDIASELKYGIFVLFSVCIKGTVAEEAQWSKNSDP